MLIASRQVVGSRILPNPVRREIPRPCPARHSPACGCRQKVLQPGNWHPETLVAAASIDQHPELHRLLNPLSVPARSLPHPSGLPCDPGRTDLFLRSRRVGLRIRQGGITNLAHAFVVSLHRAGGLRSSTRHRGYQYHHSLAVREDCRSEEQTKTRVASRGNTCFDRAVRCLN